MRVHVAAAIWNEFPEKSEAVTMTNKLYHKSTRQANTKTAISVHYRV